MLTLKANRRACQAVLLAVIACLPLGASAATYYIAPGGSGSGTVADPFGSFSTAISTAQPGDTIYARGGTYNLASAVSISSSKNGTAANPYNLFAYPGETPILNGSGGRGIELRGQYWHLDGLVVQNSGDNGIYLTGSNNIVE